MPAAIYRPITIAKLAEQLNADVRRVRQTLLRIQKATGAKILRKVGEGKAARYYVTMASLRKYVPEMFDEDEEMQRAIRARFAEIEAVLDEMSRKTASADGRHDEQIRDLRARIGAVERRLRETATSARQGA